MFRSLVAPKLGAAVVIIALFAAAESHADRWTPTSIANAPTARTGHTAVWAGAEMIVWGGFGELNSGGFGTLNSGGRYNPVTDTWTPISTVNAPTGRSGHTAVWTGSEMIIWGGSTLPTGGRYNPSTDTWTTTTTTNAPTARQSHSAVWTGSEMIIWGGGNLLSGTNLNSGARYSPAFDAWTPTTIMNAPEGRAGHVAVWTGEEMIILAGQAPGQSNYPAVAGRYRASTDTWVLSPDLSYLEAAGRGWGVSAVWGENTLIAWGGRRASDETFTSSGLRFAPPETWSRTSETNAPTARAFHEAVWTGTEMVVWGGLEPTIRLGTTLPIDTGGRYNPLSDSWVPTTMTGAPTPRTGHTAVWGGTEMIVFGGAGPSYPPSPPNFLNTGGRYDPRPDLSVSDAQIVEGQAGSSLLAFALTLSHPVNQLTVSYSLAAGTATPVVDYVAPSGTVLVPTGQTTATILVRVSGDTAVEGEETLNVTLNSLTKANLVRSQAVGTILNDDPASFAETVLQYRLYHEGTKEHLYTKDANEYNVLGTKGWAQEGVAYKLLTNGFYGGVPTIPVFRLYHAGILQHHWTPDANEAAVLATERSWMYEGTVGYLLPAQVAGTVPLYRMALASPPLHLWTTDVNEYNVLATRGWVKEGIVGYVIP